MTIVLVPAAMGGSSLDEWASGGKLSGTQSRAQGDAERNLGGYLWHQGTATFHNGLG
jgi:hypothetical protein